jgi:hypothetical protein
MMTLPSLTIYYRENAGFIAGWLLDKNPDTQWVIVELKGRFKGDCDQFVAHRSGYGTWQSGRSLTDCQIAILSIVNPELASAWAAFV